MKCELLNFDLCEVTELLRSVNLHRTAFETQRRK